MNKVDMILVNLSNHKIDIFEASSSICEHLETELKKLIKPGDILKELIVNDCIEIVRKNLT